MKNLNFNELSLSKEILDAVNDMGFVEASPIQSQAIPYLLEGRDVIGQAQTGTGKTAAFGIPALEMIDPNDKYVQALVMCPTRELALQVCVELKKLAKYKRGVNLLPVYGGESIERQITTLKRGVHIVVGTPGRIIDHIQRKTLKLDRVKMVILDEADEMLNMGFRDDIEDILKNLPSERQTVLFSATMAKPILALTKKFQTNPEMIKVTKNEMTVSKIEQTYYELKESNKIEIMSQLIDLYALKLILVFCNTKRKVDEVMEELKDSGLKAEALHGDLRQNQRNMVMTKFRNGQVNILVATDVAARGIDVSNVDAVFNFDLPLDIEAYVHRIGRTGRAGKEGKSITFITGRNEANRLREIENYIKAKITKATTPSFKDILQFKKIRLAEQLKGIVAGDLEKYEVMIADLMKEGFTLHQLAAALLKLSLGETEPKKEKNREEREGDREGGRERRDRRDRREGSGERRERRESSGERREKRPRTSSGNGKMVRLFINVGKKDKIRPGDIVGAIASEANIPGSDIGSIDILENFSFVEIPKGSVDNVLEAMNKNQIKGKNISIEVAKN